MRGFCLASAWSVVCHEMMTSVAVTRPRSHLSLYARERIRQLTCGTGSTSDIVEALKTEGLLTCRQIVWRIQRHIEIYGTIQPLPKLGRPTKLTTSVLQSIENAMQRDDETTGK